MPLVTLTAAEARRKPTVKYNSSDGKRTYGAHVEALAVRPTAPSAPGLTTTTVGGVMAATTGMTYVVTAIANYVESLPSAAATVTTGAGSTNSVDLTINTVTGARHYNVYGRTAGTELFIMTVDVGSTTVHRDTGAVTPSGAQPSGAITAGTVVLRIPNLPAGSGQFPRRHTILAEAATSLGQAGRYEYFRTKQNG